MPPPSSADTPIAAFPAANVVVYGAFLLTGIALVLPGAMLPTLLVRWNLGDARAGLLLFVCFFGSMNGAVFSRGRLPYSIARGCLAVALGAAGLLAASPITAFVAIAAYGLGLGMVMTSVALLQSRRVPHSRSSEMARLNLTWSLGACMGPALALKAGALFGLMPVLLSLAAAFALAGVLSLFLVPDVPEAPPEPKPHPGASADTPVARLAPAASITALLAIACATGIESSSGGWLSTYAERSGHGLNATVGATTCFWAGMLLSRAIQSHRRTGTAAEPLIMRGGPLLMFSALALLILAAQGPIILALAFALGFGAGPMYPLLLSRALEHGEAGNAAFVLAGIGSALLPLLTGGLSRLASSLRAGLCVPLTAALALSCLCIFLESRARARRTEAAQVSI